MESITDLIKRLDQLLQQHNPVNYRRLQPPLPDDAILSYLKMIGIDDEDVFAFYKWKNGVAQDDEESAMLFYFELAPLSLKRVLEYKKLYADNFDENLIMLFASPFDTKLLFNRRKGEDYGKLHVHSVPLLSIEEPYSYYDSLEKMIKTIVKIYESGTFIYDKENDMLDCDAKIARSITRSLNVKSNYWQQEI